MEDLDNEMEDGLQSFHLDFIIQFLSRHTNFKLNCEKFYESFHVISLLELKQ